MINFALAREIYGQSPWMIDPISFSSLFNILKDFRNGVQLNFEGEKHNSISALNIKSEARTAYSEWDIDEEIEGEYVSLIRLDGAITKNGGMSSYGMKQLSKRMDKMSNNAKVIGHVIITDSGGGSANAVPFMRDSIQYSQSKNKPVIQLIEKGGLNASAAYYIGSYADYIMSEVEENIVGSIGTMIEFQSFPKQHTDPDGVVHVRAYATASVDKNKSFEDALEGKLDLLVSEVLDPHNKKFMSDVKSNRPNVSEDQLTGKIFKAGDVVGTLIDSIGNLTDAIDKVVELSSQSINPVATTQKNEPKAKTPNNNNNLNNKKMTSEQLKQEHPDVFNAVFKQGVLSERDRAGAWLAHSETDMEAVKEGIVNGESISQTQTQEFIVKAASLSHLNNLEKDSAKKVKPAEAKNDQLEQKSKEEKEEEDFYNKVDEKMNLNKE